MLYMPGLLQMLAKKTQEGVADTTPVKQPENLDLHLPSNLSASDRDTFCHPSLPSIEEKLRTAQCCDALEGLRHILRVKTRMVYFKNKNVRGQREGTRSRAVIDRVHARARAFADKYRDARKAKLALSGPGDWEAEFRPLSDSDIRSCTDADRVRKQVGRKGAVDEAEGGGDVGSGGGAAAGGGGGGGADGFSLLPEKRARRDGTGETRRTLSWIWTTQIGVAGPTTAKDDIMRAEWAKSRARANRASEEVLLLREEMRRVLVFLEWKAQWWMARASMRKDVDGALSEALVAYAADQADLQRLLRTRFKAIWKGPLGEAKAEAERGDGATLQSLNQLPAPGDDDDDDDDEDDEDLEECDQIEDYEEGDEGDS